MNDTTALASTAYLITAICLFSTGHWIGASIALFALLILLLNQVLNNPW